MVAQLRKNFPSTITSETVKKFSIAPNNESYVINALQFIGIIDEDGKRTERGHDVFVLGEDAFPSAFEKLVQEAYKDLFDLRGDGAWSLSKDALTAYFRATDKTSEAIGSRQAAVFQTFRSLSGHDHVSETIATKSKRAKSKASSPKKQKVTETKPSDDPKANTEKKDVRTDMALTVRIEINLPANGSQETYDNIFKSIRANLING